MSKNTLYDKVWDQHVIQQLPSGQDQLFIGLHLIHEVTTPQAFAALKESDGSVACPHRTFATVDHIIPTTSIQRPYKDTQAEKMAEALEENVSNFGIKFFSPETKKQGIVHVIGPERGLTRPGMTIACGDSHTSTHGAFGSLAFGIGTSEVRFVLETQTLPLSRLNVRRINVTGKLSDGVTPKDVVLRIIQELGVKGGIGYAYEFGGQVFDKMSMEGRMTVCNMSIEGGARIGYVNPDQTTFDYIKGREFSPVGDKWEAQLSYWKSIQSDKDAVYDDVVTIRGESIEPMVTWGVTPAQSVAVTQNTPLIESFDSDEKINIEAAYNYMKWTPGQAIKGQKINVGFIGSCTNSRLSDLEEAATILKGKKVHADVKLLVVPGSQPVKEAAEKLGLDKIVKESGAEWREPGCSMCLAMNPDKLDGDEICASTSNRNFMGRQGSPTGKNAVNESTYGSCSVN